MPEPAIQLTNVVKSFGAERAVDGLSLNVHTGETLALLGPSGCGKTTLLRLVAGFEEPDSGEIAIHGRKVHAPGVSIPPEKRNVGFVFQEYALFPHLSVQKNVEFGLRGRSGRAARVAEMLELVGLKAEAGRMPHELSGGQQQRVALARSLAPRPELLLLDEPYSNLDAALRIQVREELRRILTEAGATSIFVTHDQEEALSLGTRVGVMEEGKLLACATPEEIYRRPPSLAVARVVGGSNLVPAKADGEFAISPLGRLPLASPIGTPNNLMDVLLVIRPEQIRLEGDTDGADEATIGTVLSRQYHGSHQHLSVRINEDLELDARLGPGIELAPTARVRVAITEPVAALPRDGG